MLVPPPLPDFFFLLSFGEEEPVDPIIEMHLQPYFLIISVIRHVVEFAL